MKIAILTFHRALNYGALLQAYGLQQAVLKCGHEVEILDYRNEIIEKAYYYPTLRERKSIKSILKYFVQGRFEIGRRNKFEHFRECMLIMSKCQYDADNIDKANNEYDLFVVGSDQVWNYQAHGFDKNYYLDFVTDSKKKASFAASIGLSELPESIRKNYRELLNNYSVCSVREEKGADILSSLGLHVRTDLDPSFLLTSDEWIEKFNIQKKNDRFIFAYYFELTPSLKAFIEELAKKTGLRVKYLGYAFKSPFNCDTEPVKTADPIDFVDCMVNAQYVVTNSFHGTAFSINFNKKFFVELLKKDEKVNSRLTNILDSTGLLNRQIRCFKDVDAAIESEIDWRNANRALMEMRSKSQAYITRGFR